MVTVVRSAAAHQCPLSIAAVCVLAACSVAPREQGQPVRAPIEPRLLIRFIHLPATAWELEARTESGEVRRKDGVGDVAELRLPPGPAMLALRSGRREFFLPCSIGNVEDQALTWDLAVH